MWAAHTFGSVSPVSRPTARRPPAAGGRAYAPVRVPFPGASRTLDSMWLTWREAAERALYGAAGFYLRTGAAADNFRTSVRATPRYAAALVRLMTEVDAALLQPPEFDLVDVGAGRGELLAQLRGLAPAHLAARLRPTAVELAPRPDDLDAGIDWRPELPHRITGLVIANEWLDNVPVDVVERGADGLRLVLVDPASGAERAGGPPEDADVTWVERWWPPPRVGDRAEVGRSRDEAWAAVVGRLRRGLAVAVDYAHERSTRPPYGTLTAYRGGHSVPPVPDGSCDITAHVALDACAAAGRAAGAEATLLTTQRDALRSLGIRGERPPVTLAHTDAPMYLRRLQEAGEEGELLDPAGFGGFGCLVQTVGVSLPPSL